jgi:hypothetical protein
MARNFQSTRGKAQSSLLTFRRDPEERRGVFVLFRRSYHFEYLTSSWALETSECLCLSLPVPNRYSEVLRFFDCRIPHEVNWASISKAADPVEKVQKVRTDGAQ